MTLRGPRGTGELPVQEINSLVSPGSGDLCLADKSKRPMSELLAQENGGSDYNTHPWGRAILPDKLLPRTDSTQACWLMGREEALLAGPGLACPVAVVSYSSMTVLPHESMRQLIWCHGPREDEV